MDNLEKKVFVIMPVRGITKDEQKFLEKYVAGLKSKGYAVYFPLKDTNQKDKVGLDICIANREAIRKADEVHLYYNPKSEGSKFDFGMTFMAEKPLILINRDAVQPTPYKSFENVLLALDAKYKEKKA